MSIIRPRVWTQQPQFDAGMVDSYKDATTVWMPHSKLINLGTSKTIYTQNGTQVYVPTSGSVGLKGAAYAAKNYLQSPDMSPVTSWPGVTVICVIYIDSTVSNSNYPPIIGFNPRWTGFDYGGYALRIEKDSSGNTSALFKAGNNSTGILTSTSLFNGGSQLATIIGSWDKSTLRMVGRGEKCGSFAPTPVSATNSWATDTPWREYVLGGYYSASDRTTLHPVHALVVLPRALPVSEMVSIADNPWQIFRQRVT